MNHRTLSLLLVEDDQLDAEMFRRTLRKRSVEADLRVAADGQVALEILHARLESDVIRDTIVFLDLNMPGMNGHEFLDELRSDPRTKDTIVFVLTSSDHERDIRLAYSKNVAGYFTKDRIERLLDMLLPYAETVRFPVSDEPLGPS